MKNKKIAFLFLTLSDPNFPDIWDKYFKGNEDKYSIYIHPKNPNQVEWRRECIIKNLVNTEWGMITRAYIELFKAAFVNADNFMFITVSESCVPIVSFDILYKNLLKNNKSIIKFEYIKRYNEEVRIDQFIQKLNKTKISPPKIFIKHYARFCLNKYDASRLLNKASNGDLDFFYKMPIGDEFFLSSIYPFNLKRVENRAITEDNWIFTQIQLKKIKENAYKFLNEGKQKEYDILKKEYNIVAGHPKVINDTREELREIMESKAFFYRKFKKTSNIKKYWEKIIRIKDKQKMDYNDNKKIKIMTYKIILPSK